MKKIGLVGNTALNIEKYDGQTIKTKEIINIFDSIKKDSLFVVDTYNYTKHFFSTTTNLFKCLSKCDNIIIIVSTNGKKVLFPFFYYANKIFNKNIYHIAIGSKLALELKNNKRWRKYLKSFKKNWLESFELIEIFKDYGINNASYFPNIKNIKVVNKNNVFSEPFSFCIFSRIQEEKGITDAIDSIIRINNEKGKIVAKLDLYGTIDNNYKNTLDKYLADNGDCIKYCGCANPYESSEIISNYYMLLFPTKYYYEGIPGTIIDSFFAHTPCISSNWKYCNELINNNVDGISYDFSDKNKLYESVKYAINNPNIVYMLRNNIKNKYKYYLPEKANILINDEFFNY